MIEWSEKNKYSSFNSYKGLTYFENYKKIVGWFDGKNELPPPIEASLDPVNACNNNCYYCNSQRYLREEPAHLKRWGIEYMEELLINLSNWGVKGFCWGGGGESTLNLRLAEMTRAGVLLGMECSIITNGVLMDDALVDALLLCRWIGISIDSAHPAIYRQVRGTDDCLAVLNNIKRLVAKRKKTDIAMKVLVLPETIDTIYYTCQVAKELGVQDFHVRPVDLERKDFYGKVKLNLEMKRIKDIFEQCHKLETPDFHVFTVTHKYDENFHVKHDFKRCLASPLVAQICTDKRKYICLDHRLEEKYEIKEWGSDEHRKMLQGVDPDRDCGRCTFGEYNKQIEEVVIHDKMCRSFP